MSGDGGDGLGGRSTASPPVSPSGGPPAVPPAAGAAGARPPATGRRRHGQGTVGDVVRSLLVVLGFALVLVWLTPRPDPETVRVVDYRSSLSQARQSAGYPVLAPEGLPEGWRATSARARPAGRSAYTWHLGLVTPTGRYAAVEQSSAPGDPFVRSVSRQGEDAGTVPLAGQQWRRLLAAGEDQRTLWRPAEGSTVAVTGNATWAELEQLAGALR